MMERMTDDEAGSDIDASGSDPMAPSSSNSSSSHSRSVLGFTVIGLRGNSTRLTLSLGCLQLQAPRLVSIGGNWSSHDHGWKRTCNEQECH